MKKLFPLVFTFVVMFAATTIFVANADAFKLKEVKVEKRVVEKKKAEVKPEDSLVREDVDFIRGDANGDGQLTIADPMVMFQAFSGDMIVHCDDALDANDDGAFTIADPPYMINYLFQGGTPPPAPLAEAGQDPTADDLGCPALGIEIPVEEEDVVEEVCGDHGDANGDGNIDISDLVTLLTHVRGVSDAPCLHGADANGDGAVNIADIPYLSEYLF